MLCLIIQQLRITYESSYDLQAWPFSSRLALLDSRHL